MKPISPQHVVEVSGAALKNDLEGVGGQMMADVDAGRIVVVRGFLSPEEVQKIRAECGQMLERRPPEAGRLTFRSNNPDIHSTEAPHFSLRSRISAYLHGRKLRFRRIHSYKLFLWNKRDEAVDRAILGLIRLRNRLYGVPLDFAVGEQDDFFTMVGVQHYRKGGGFLTEHSDAEFHVRQGLVTRFELIAMLSKKGVDYREGGLFVRVDGRRYSVDELVEPGDVVVYDVKRPHGVAPVDPGEAEHPRAGRWIVLVPPFRRSQYLEDMKAATPQPA